MSVLLAALLVSVSAAIDYRSQQVFERNFSSLQLRELIACWGLMFGLIL